MRTERVSAKKATKKVSKKVAKTVVKRVVKGLDPSRVQVSVVMSRRVKTVRPDTNLDVAMDLMMSKDISHLPVTDQEGNLVGIISKTDMVRRFFMDGDTEVTDLNITGKNGVKYSPGPGFHEDKAIGRVVSDVMSKVVRTVAHDASLVEAATSMAKHRIHGLPVVSQKALVGFVSTFDIVGWIASRN